MGVDRDVDHVFGASCQLRERRQGVLGCLVLADEVVLFVIDIIVGFHHIFGGGGEVGA